ncbi:MAG: dihydrolipoamide acetyltransferase family protein [Deltaproteobacteria bacterium]|nr:dihydrolipoamide acetyltransferase family protein [Deltaproteobacteria bacterium]
MAKIIELPKLSPTMEEGTLVRWVKPVGDRVEVDDLLAEVETDKATMEFRAFDRGTLLARLVAEGQVTQLGQPVAILGEPGEDISALLATLGAAPAVSPPAAPASVAATMPQAPAMTPAEAPSHATAGHALVAPVSSVDVFASVPGVAGLVLLPQRDAALTVAKGEPGGPSSPRVRQLARSLSVDLASVRGSGEDGRIRVEDVERAATASGPRAEPAAIRGSVAAVGSARSPSVVIPASSMRKTIARRLTESKQTVPHFYLEVDLDVEGLLALREQLNEGAEKERKISVNDLFVRACAVALREVPLSNASWMDGSIVRHTRVDISVAVAVEDGLVTPVVRDADQKSVSQIALEIRDLAGRAKSKKLKPEEMQDGVFSISNLGMYGVDRFSAVINPPEGMILAVGAARDVPVVRGGAVVPGKRCAVTLSCDHRVVDGALGAQFLAALRAIIERPIRVLA